MPPLKLNDESKQLVLDILSGFTFGDTIPHSWIDNQLQLDDPASINGVQANEQAMHKMCVLDKAKDMLLINHQIHIVNVRGVGYKLVEPKEQTDVVMKNFSKKIKGTLRKTHKGLTNIRTSHLSHTERQRNVDAQTLLRGFGRTAQKRLP